MSDTTAELTASLEIASMPVGEILGKFRRSNQVIEQLTERLDELLAERMRLEAAERGRIEEIQLLNATVQLLQAKCAKYEKRAHLSLVQNQALPALLQRQAE